MSTTKVPSSAATVKPSNVIPLSSSTSSTVIEALQQLNREIVVVRSLAQIAELPTPTRREINIISFASFANELYANRSFNGSPIARQWIRWPNRREVSTLTYAPGKPLFCDDALNTWIPPSLKPTAADLSPWTEYLTHIFSSDPTYLDWFLAWLAYPLQHPGTKLHTACVFWSTQTGTGKSTLGYIMKSLYGEQNFAEISEADLNGPFNHWAARRQFIMGEEIRGANARNVSDRLKAIITRHTVTVNLKYKAQYEIPDCLNYYFTSNHSEAFYLDPSERRFFVHELPNKKLSAAFYQDCLKPWLDAGGYEAILHSLLTLDLTKPIVGGDPYSTDPAPFRKGAAAPLTRARQAMIEESLDDAEGWLKEFVESPQNFLDDPSQTLFTPDDLLALYTTSRPTAKVSLSHFMRRAHVFLTRVGNGNPVRLENGQRKRLISLNPEHVKLAHDELKELYESGTGTVE